MPLRSIESAAAPAATARIGTRSATTLNASFIEDGPPVVQRPTPR
jgi:hypothetical protein